MYGVITNANSISVELCDTARDGRYQASEATLQNAAALCRKLMRKPRFDFSSVNLPIPVLEYRRIYIERIGFYQKIVHPSALQT